MSIRKDVNQLQHEILQLKKQLTLSEREKQKFQQLAERDFLTGLYNRHGFIREAERFLQEMKAERRQKGRRRATIISNIYILFIDVDDLKKMNDRFGHVEGDRYLRLIGQTLVKAVRAIDVVGRWGGDEFAIALINTNDASACVIAQKMQRLIGKIRLGNSVKGFVCSASIGLISVDGVHNKRASYNLVALIEKADKAMYEVKKSKKKGVFVSFPECL